MRRYGSWPFVLATLVGSAVIGSIATVVVVALIQGTGVLEALGDTELLTRPWTIFVAILISDATLLLTVYLLLIRRGIADWRRLGLGPGKVRHPVLQGLGYGILFLVASAAVSTVLAHFGVEQDQARQFPLEGAGPLAATGVMVAGVVFAPVAEEIFFRGFIFQAMSERKGLIRGLVYSSALFAAVHANVAAFLPLATGAAVLAYSFKRTGTLWTPIAAHAVNNTFALALLLSGGA
jgi:membrane protease YdiL (CAAX protease family)